MAGANGAKAPDYPSQTPTPRSAHAAKEKRRSGAGDEQEDRGMIVTAEKQARFLHAGLVVIGERRVQRYERHAENDGSHQFTAGAVDCGESHEEDESGDA